MTLAEQATASQESFLVADCGTTNTTLALFDVAAGGYRLIARASSMTTAGAPHFDICKGVQQAAARITEVTGRELINERGDLIKPSRRNRVGVDRFVAVVSAAAPLQTVLAGISDDVSLLSARKALSMGYYSELDCITPMDGRDERSRVAAIINGQPDLIFLVGGTDGGAERRLMGLVDTLSLGVSVMAGAKRPHVLYAGNVQLREWTRHALAEHATVQVTDNVRPELDKEAVGDAAIAARELYTRLKIYNLPGVQKLRDWCDYPIVPTAQSFATIVQYFAALQKSRAMGIDLGSGSTTAVVCNSERTRLSIRTDRAMGRPIVNLLSSTKANAIRGRLPHEIGLDEVKDYIHNKALHPNTIPMTELESQLEQAVAAQVLSDVLGEARSLWGWDLNGDPKLNMLLVRGRVLTKMPRPGQAILTMLDAIQPAGLFSVAMDTYGVLPALGTLAAHDPLAVVQALEGGALTSLGWVCAPSGKGQSGQRVLNITMESENVRRLEVDVAYGTLEVLPLAAGESAEITLEPARRFDIGFGPGQGKKITLHGGAVGLIVDARGRPLEQPSDEGKRRELARQWSWDVGG